MKLRFVAARPETADVVSFLFEPPHGFGWKPGQYLHWTLPHDDADDRGVERYFTIASAPHEDAVMLTTRIAAEHGSSFKRALGALRPGDTVEVDSPAEGSFTLEDLDTPHVFVAGGIGITPFRAILLDLDQRGENPQITLVYANRGAEAPFAAELEGLAARLERLTIRYVVEPELVDEGVLREAAAGADPTFWVSGPKPMVDAVQRMLDGMGVEQTRIRRDAFPGYD